MIQKWYEIICDSCGNAQHFFGSVKLAEAQFREYGGIVTKDKKHYCGRPCKRKGKS